MIILFFHKSTFTHSLTNKLRLLSRPHTGGFALDPRRTLSKCAIVMAICRGNLPWAPTDGSQVTPYMCIIRHSYVEWQLWRWLSTVRVNYRQQSIITWQPAVSAPASRTPVPLPVHSSSTQPQLSTSWSHIINLFVVHQFIHQCSKTKTVLWECCTITLLIIFT